MYLNPDDLHELATDVGIAQRVHAMIENEFIELRDAHISTSNANGLAVREFDGSPSGVIRIGTEDAIRLTLNVLGEIIEERQGRQRFRLYSSETLIVCETCDTNVLRDTDGDPLLVDVTAAAGRHVCDPMKVGEVEKLRVRIKLDAKD